MRLAGSRGNWSLRLLWEPRDMWVGLYWVHDVQGWDGGWWEGWRFYLTLIPCLPLRLAVDRSLRDTRAYRRWGGNARSGRAYRAWGEPVT